MTRAQSTLNHLQRKNFACCVCDYGFAILHNSILGESAFRREREQMRKSIYIILLLIHIGLGVWAAMGLAEWVGLAVPWPRVSNPLFPRWLLWCIG